MRKKVSSILLVLFFLVGLSLLLYPTVSDYWNSLHQSQAIVAYSQKVENLNKDVYEQLWNNAKAYNQKLFGYGGIHKLSKGEYQSYDSQLRVPGSDVMGYVEISKIGCSLPIYHGTDSLMLQSSIGHIDWSSLPIGGKSTHSVLSGHRGLPRAKLFTDLDKLVEGDTFVLRVLDETFTYEVDQIRTVQPEDTNELEIVEGKDYCTLVTCTPYGINTERLLVRGYRIDNAQNTEAVLADAMQIEPIIVAPVVAVPMLLILLILLLVKTRKKNTKQGE